MQKKLFLSAAAFLSFSALAAIPGKKVLLEVTPIYKQAFEPIQSLLLYDDWTADVTVGGMDFSNQINSFSFNVTKTYGNPVYGYVQWLREGSTKFEVGPLPKSMDPCYRPYQRYNVRLLEPATNSLVVVRTPACDGDNIHFLDSKKNDLVERLILALETISLNQTFSK